MEHRRAVEGLNPVEEVMEPVLQVEDMLDSGMALHLQPVIAYSIVPVVPE